MTYFLQKISKFLVANNHVDELIKLSSFHKLAISYEDALESLKSKKFKKRIKKVVVDMEKEKHPDRSYQDIAEDPNVQDNIDEYVESMSMVFQNRIPHDLEDSEKGLSLLWLLNIVTDKSLRAIIQNIHSELALGGEITALETFFHYKDFMSEKDLFKIKSPAELTRVTIDAYPAIKEYQDKKNYEDAEEGKELIHSDDEWEVYEVHNKGAACELGKGTDWCTAAPGLDYFKQYYSEDSPLFIFINKQNPEEKYQFSYKNNEYMDKNDIRVDYEIIKSLTDLISEELKKYPSIYKMWFDKDGFKEVDDNGKITYYKYGKIHRDDGPAIIVPGYKKTWYKNGKIHREDGPAEEWSDGRKEWYKDGERHREGGPAVYGGSSYESWHKNGRLHRVGGPAVTFTTGEKQWFLNGVLHREDGPAIEYKLRDTSGENGDWFLFGIKYPKSVWERKVKELHKEN